MVYIVPLYKAKRGANVHVLRTECARSSRAERPGARFSKVPETFRARKAIFSSSVSENGEVYTPEISCVERTSVCINKT